MGRPEPTPARCVNGLGIAVRRQNIVRGLIARGYLDEDVEIATTIISTKILLPSCSRGNPNVSIITQGCFIMTAFQNINIGAGYIPGSAAIYHLANDGRTRENSPPTAASVKVQRLLSIDPENRLLSLLKPRGSFTEGDIRNAETIVADFLNPAANRELLDLAGLFVDSGLDPHDIPDAWLTDERKSAFHKSLTDSRIPDTEVIFAYACIELFQLALANYNIQQRRRRPKPDFTGYQPTAEELESEAEFSSALSRE